MRLSYEKFLISKLSHDLKKLSTVITCLCSMMLVFHLLLFFLFYSAFPPFAGWFIHTVFVLSCFENWRVYKQNRFWINRLSTSTTMYQRRIARASIYVVEIYAVLRYRKQLWCKLTNFCWLRACILQKRLATITVLISFLQM